jgi:hypothetical protein
LLPLYTNCIVGSLILLHIFLLFLSIRSFP